MNIRSLLALPFLLLLITPLAAKGQTAELRWTFSDLGTDEMTSIEAHGVTIHFPPDQRDVVDLLIPVVKDLCDVRKESAAKEATWLLKLLKSDVLELPRARVPKIIATERPSESFDKTLAEVKDDIKLLSENWKQWSGEIGEIYFWNRNRVKDFSQGQMLRFPEMHLRKNEQGLYSALTLTPPFYSERTVGLDKFRLKEGTVSPLRIDIPIAGEPGMSALEVSELLSESLVDIAKALVECLPKVNPELSPYTAEKFILAEIEAGYFNAEKPPRPEVLLRALARVHYFFVENSGKTGDDWQFALKLSRFELPNDRDEALAFLDELEGIDIFDPGLEAEYRQAASRFVFMGMLLAAQETNYNKPIFHVLRDLGEPIPDGGYDQAEFLEVARRIYPPLDRHIETSRDKLLEAARVLIENRFPEEKKSADEAIGADRESDLPENYKTKRFGEFTLTYPGEVSEAVDRIGGSWTAEFAGARQGLIQEDQEKEPVNLVEVTEEDLSSLESYGFEIEPESVKQWRHAVATMMNADWAFGKLFAGNRIAIWMKEDIKSVLAEGGHIENFSYDFDRNVATTHFSAPIKLSDLPDDFTSADLQSAFAAIKPQELSVVLRKEDIDGKSVDEQIAAIRSDHQLVEMVISEDSRLTPESFLGMTQVVKSESEAFFLIVHELVEGSLIQTTIASRDRRWFCDGLANAIAIRECDRRFGKGVGREAFESLYDLEKFKPMRDQVNLMAWKAGENERENVAEVEGLIEAHYYFATEAILAALDERDGEFIAKWIAKIRETNWERTNAKTVISAFNEIAADVDLEMILSEHSGSVR